MKMINELFDKYLENQCSPEEVKELLAHFNIAEDESGLKRLITESLENDADNDGSQWKPHTDKIFVEIKNQLSAENGKLVPLFKKKWFQLAAAAVFVVGAFAVYNLINSTNKKQDIVAVDPLKTEVDPGSNKAILTLADRSTIILESVINGTVAQQGGTKIIKSADGQLVYKSLNEKPTEVLYNSIATPRSGQYQLILSDGSKVWLNAASSLRFPAAFAGSERKVELSGEAYFEVAKNASVPFKVEIAGKGEVEVLGTHFNVNAYSDEATVNTTLLEGSVKVTALATRELHIIAPGEQVQLHANGRIRIYRDADTEQAIAWKNGTFNFTNAELGIVMRQLSRWYDVDIEFDGAVSQRQFSGEIQRNLKLSQVLKLLEKNNVFCTLQGKKLIVQQ